MGEKEERVSDVPGVYSVYGVYDDSNAPSDVIPMVLLQEYRDTYKQLRAVPREKLAPHGTLLWNVPESGLANEMVTPDEYCRRLIDLAKSNDLRKVTAGRDEMQRKLALLK